MKTVYALVVLAILAAASIPSKAAQYNFTPDAVTTVENICTTGVAIGKGKTCSTTQLDVAGSSTRGTAGAGNVIGNGNGTAPTQDTISGLQVLKVSRVGTANTATGGIYISTVIFVASSYETLLSSAGNLLMTATPTISTTTVKGGLPLPEGSILVITSTDAINTISLQDNGTLSGSLLELGAASRAITAKKVLRLHFDGTSWIEDSYGNN